MFVSTMLGIECEMPSDSVVAINIVGIIMAVLGFLLKSEDAELEELSRINKINDLQATIFELELKKIELEERSKQAENDRRKKVILCNHPCKRKVR